MKQKARTGFEQRKPSWTWAAAAALAGAVAAGAITGAVLHQRQADRPIGEGQLFLEESAAAQTMVETKLGGGMSLDETVRHVRNALGIEAVGIVDGEGRLLSVTSANLVGTQIHDGLLAFGLSPGRFAAVAAPLTQPMYIDGVVEWGSGEVLYQVLQPVSGGDGALLLYYDVSELLERRQRTHGTQPATQQLLGLAVSFIVVALLLLIGRARAVSHFRKVMVETEYLRRHSAELEQHNRELDVARAEAERALALAEETNRIRAEFVLMINHELRTPLTSVVTGAELIQSDLELTPIDRQQIVADMVTDGRRLQEMITQMLAVARIENRGLDYTLREVPVADVRQEIERRHPKAWRHDTPRHLDPDGAYLWTDPTTLSQLIASLTDNAFTHGATQVELAHTNCVPFTPMMEFGNRPEQVVCFLVRDNGPGIDLDFLPRAFEKFEKHGPSLGTGLGLYVARIMVEALQGSLAVETSPKGTTMAVAVPLVGSVAPTVAR